MQYSESPTQLLELIEKVSGQYPKQAQFPIAIVSIGEQKLYAFLNAELIGSYPVSTSRFGVGQEEGSYKTPIGIHCVKEKIGEDAKITEIFKTRERTHKLAAIEHKEIKTDQDCITSRILWLEGLEEGINKGAGVDSFERYIYIHGTNEEGLIGQPASEGCIRMNNEDVINLFSILEISSLVIVKE